MKKKIGKFTKHFSIVLGVLLVVSCKNEGRKKRDVPSSAETQNEQVYNLDMLGASVGWTAYKFTERASVHGVFEDFVLLSQEDAKSIEALLKGSKIMINTLSVNSGSEVRDDKLRTNFFKVFHTDSINGAILNATNGRGTLALKMNGIKNDVDYTYTLDKDTLALSTTLDLTKWKGGEAMNELNKACYELHTGPDGISKLWPDVLVIVKLPILKNSVEQ